MKIKVFQFEIYFGDVEKNIEKVKGLFERSVFDGIDTAVLPEMWTTGYDLENIDKHAMDDLHPVVDTVSELARKYDINIVAGSVANNKGNGVLNTAFMVDRQGELVHEYSKIHLVPMLSEPEFLIGGENRADVFELDGEKMGVVICYDLRFPELFRDLSLEEAKVIYVVAEWPIERTEHWLILLKARAIENQCYIVASNTIGTQPTGTTFAGNSIVINPFGEVLAQAQVDNETSIVSELDLEYIKKIRKDIPIFESRRKEFYKFL